MNQIKKFFLTMMMALGFLAVAAVPAAAKEYDLSDFQPDVTPVVGKVHVIGYVHINNEKVDDLFHFTTNLDNDAQWYPGILSSTLTQGDGKTGSEYAEVVNLGFGNIPITATVLAYDPLSHFQLTSNGFLANTTDYYYVRGKDQSPYFVINSYVDAGPGVTQAAMDGYMQGTFMGLLHALNKTGEITIVQ